MNGGDSKGYGAVAVGPLLQTATRVWGNGTSAWARVGFMDDRYGFKFIEFVPINSAANCESPSPAPNAQATEDEEKKCMYVYIYSKTTSINGNEQPPREHRNCGRKSRPRFVSTTGHTRASALNNSL